MAKFRTSDGLIDLLVGQSLYSNADVAMRELLQNAEDACYLQKLADPNHNARIVVSYSASQQWIEISDNGFGMDAETFDDSFATIGASKRIAPKLQDLLKKDAEVRRTIGQFGIGILSCFGIADVIEVRSRMHDGSAPVAYRIQDRHGEFSALPDIEAKAGTSIRLELRPNGPMKAEDVPQAVRRYVRHARHIFLHNQDSGQEQQVEEAWLNPEWANHAPFTTDAISAGHLQLSEAWDNINAAIDCQLMICNGGFLTQENANTNLPIYFIGVRGELDVHPGSLTILMNREGFQNDDNWNALAGVLLEKFRVLVASKIAEWEQLPLSTLRKEQLRGMQRMALILLKTEMIDIVGQQNAASARRFLPKVLLQAEETHIDLTELIKKAKSQPPMYVMRTDEQLQVQRSFAENGQNISVTEAVGSVDLRVSLLRLNGFTVTKAERHDFSIVTATGHKAIRINDYDVLRELCKEDGLEIKRVQEAPTEHTQIGTSPDAQAITRAFELSSEIKLQPVENMAQAIIADFNGYILNIHNDEIRKILRIVPDAVGNPIRKELLIAYLHLSSYRVLDARPILLRLLTDEDFDVKVQRKTGRYLKKYLEERVSSLLDKGEQ